MARELVFTPEQVEAFCRETGDPNPIHTSFIESSRLGYESTIVNGALSLSRAIGILHTEEEILCGSMIIEINSIFRNPMLSGYRYWLEIDLGGEFLSGAIAKYVCTYKQDDGRVTHKHDIICKRAIRGASA